MTGEGEKGSHANKFLNANYGASGSLDGTAFVDTSLMTQAEKARLYTMNESPRNKDTKFVRSLAQSEDNGRMETRSQGIGLKGPLTGPLGGKKGDQKKGLGLTAFVGPFGNLGQQTLASSIKTRTITKNNFGMPRVYNKKFVPVNRTEAKD